MISLRKSALRALLLLVSLALWEGAVRALRVPAFILPPPSQVLLALARGARGNVYFHDLWITLAETLLGFACGSIFAFVLGMGLARSRTAVAKTMSWYSRTNASNRSATVSVVCSGGLRPRGPRAPSLAGPQ